jgi:hypothetical protein
MSKKQPEIYKEKLLDALERSLGIVTPACKEVGISRNQFYHYYNTDADFKRAVDDINEITLDFAENQLLKKIKEGSERSILFYMRYKARRRGYTDSIDITSGGDKITEIKLIKIEREDKNGDTGN